MVNRLRKLRQDKGLTVRELGEKTSISYPTISRLETGQSNFNETNLTILADFFKVSVDYLLLRSDDPHGNAKVLDNSKDSNVSSLQKEIIEMVSYFNNEDLLMVKGYMSRLNEKYVGDRKETNKKFEYIG